MTSGGFDLWWGLRSSRSVARASQEHRESEGEKLCVGDRMWCESVREEKCVRSEVCER